MEKTWEPKVCQNLARKIASENNDKYMEESTKCFNSKVKPVEFKDEWEVLKDHNFLHKNKKLDETFKGPFKMAQP
jgi:hypothetical protein